MQAEDFGTTHLVTAAAIREKIAQASPELSRDAAAQVTALTAHLPGAQPDTTSVFEDIEGHIAALVSALTNCAPYSFKQFIQARVDGDTTPERARIVIEVVGQVIRQQMGDQVWSFVKPILDLALDWLGTQTSTAVSVQVADPTIVALYTQNILKGDRIQAEKLVFDALAQGYNLRDIYLKIIQPGLYEVGRLWEIGQISIPQEHLATAITQSVLSAIYARVEFPSNPEHHALVTCLEGNFHEIGPRMLADFLQMAGYNTRFLGTNTSVDCLIETIQTHKPDVIGLPATTSEHVDTVKLAIDRVRADFASYRPTIMVGGLAFNLIEGLWKTVRADLWSADGGHAVDQLVGSSDWM